MVIKVLLHFLLIVLVVKCDTQDSRVLRFQRAIQGPSDQTCVDDRSPAESCFDHFKLAIFWAPGLAHRYRANNANIRTDRPAQWIIHGLWPSMSARQDVPPRCTRTDISFNSNRLQRSGIMNKLDRAWYTILATNTNVRFWKHEFDSHGNCATRSRAIGDDVTYFDRTVDLYDFVNLENVLASGGIRPGSVRTLRDIINVIRDRLGVKVKVNTFQDPRTQQLYLTEIHVCFDIMLNLMSCTNNDPPRRILDSNVSYLADFE